MKSRKVFSILLLMVLGCGANWNPVKAVRFKVQVDNGDEYETTLVWNKAVPSKNDYLKLLEFALSSREAEGVGNLSYKWYVKYKIKRKDFNRVDFIDVTGKKYETRITITDVESNQNKLVGGKEFEVPDGMEHWKYEDLGSGQPIHWRCFLIELRNNDDLIGKFYQTVSFTKNELMKLKAEAEVTTEEDLWAAVTGISH